MLVIAGILKGYKLMDVSEYCDQPQDVGENTISENEEDDSEEEQVQEGVNDKVFQGSLHIILDALSKDNQSLVSEVKTVVKELRRITLLWDELWIGSLMQLNHEAQRFLYIFNFSLRLLFRCIVKGTWNIAVRIYVRRNAARVSGNCLFSIEYWLPNTTASLLKKCTMAMWNKVRIEWLNRI